MIDGKWLEVSAKDYVRSVAGDTSICQLAIKSIDLPFNTLGMPLLVDYYAVHVPETGVVSLETTLLKGGGG